MLVTFTIRCDWPGCKATLTGDTPLAITAARWKAEREALGYCRHLCPEHKRKDWHAVSQEQFGANMERAHRTPG
jgi:hypothetical protein